MTIVFFKDCGTPTKSGYAYSSATGTTYGETSAVACAVGYEGTISSSTVTCEATGAWTDVRGCTIKGKRCYLIGHHVVDETKGKCNLRIDNNCFFFR